MTTAGEPPNPYAAPAAALAHDAVGEPAGAAVAAGTGAAARWPSRLGAVVLSLIGQPLAGAGLYVLNRPRRMARWIAVSLASWALMIGAVRAGQGKVFVAALVATLVILVAAVADTTFARRGPARSTGRAWLVAIAIVLTAKGAALASGRWLAESFKMPSGSMVPALFVGDHVMVKKGSRQVERGDVVLFELPEDRNVDYIKRVVAIGGDTIEITGGIVSINGAALAQEELEGDCPEQEEPGWCALARETNQGRSYTIMRMRSAPAADQPRTTVPEGHLFVLGDNRDNSSDSRRFGPLPGELVKGKAQFVHFSRDRAGATRWSRVGRAVD